MPNTDTIRANDTRTPRPNGEGQPTPTSDAAPRREGRGGARMNGTASETPYQWQADGEG